jgi:hypothetical protein
MKFSTIIVRETANYHLVCEGENFKVHYDGTQVKFSHKGSFTYSMERVPHLIPVNLEPVFALESGIKRKFPDVPEVPEVPEKRFHFQAPRKPFVFIPTLF